jgi:hypothetical protein
VVALKEKIKGAFALLGSLLLISCSNVPKNTLEYDVLVQIREPAAIKEIGNRHGFKNALGLTYKNNKLCRIIVPKLDTRTFFIWQHEMKHCTHGKFH